MPSFTKKFEIKSGDFIHAGEGSIQIKSSLKSIGIDSDIIRRAAVCSYESEMNVVMHGGEGTLTLTVDADNIIIEVEDNGHGIEDIELAFQEGYTTALPEHREMGFGAGMGLPNIKKNADSFEIDSQKGEGLYLKMAFRTLRSDE